MKSSERYLKAEVVMISDDFYKRKVYRLSCEKLIGKNQKITGKIQIDDMDLEYNFIISPRDEMEA